MNTTGRISDSYEDFFATDEQPRIWVTTETETSRPVYHVCLPCGHRAQLSELHEVDDHADGTYSVQPKPQNSNSILCCVCAWHGYIERNVFQGD